jgi:hypothetical protein
MNREQELKEKLNTLSKHTQDLLDILFKMEQTIRTQYPDTWNKIEFINDEVDPESFLGDDWDEQD